MKQKSTMAFLGAALSALCVLFLARLQVVAQETPAPEATKQDKPKPAAEPAPPEQPIPYSHKTHLALGLQCQECHPNPEPGDRMTLPAPEKCMTCHSIVAKDKPAIQKLAEYAKSVSTSSPDGCIGIIARIWRPG